MAAPPSLGGSYRFLSEDQLLAQCEEDHYRASGPGGQKRNKTANAVRLRHRPTGFLVTATESRSLKENRLYAIRRMRIKLATDLREPIEPVRFEPPDWFLYSATRTASRPRPATPTTPPPPASSSTS